MRMRVISEVSHEIMKSMKLPLSRACLSFYVRMLTESGTNQWASVGNFDETMRPSQASEPPDIARHAQAHGTFNNGYQRK